MNYQHLQNVVDFQDSTTYMTPHLGRSLLSLSVTDFFSSEKGFEQLVEYRAEAKLALKLPNDIKAYLDSGAAHRMKKGVKYSQDWLTTNSQRAKEALAVLPVPFYKIDCKHKQALLADKIANLCNALLHSMEKQCFDYKAGALELIESSGILHWSFALIPKFSEPSDSDYWLGVIARLIDAQWWKRKITRAYDRAYEDARRAAGMVSPASDNPYCSYGQIKAFERKLEKQDEWLKSTVMRRESDGVEVSLKDIFDSSVANPSVRRAELMQRINGMQDVAEENGLQGLFITMTTPSRFHRNTKRGNHFVDNSKYDGSTVKEGQAWLCKRWQLIRSALNDANIEIMGFRVAEPHADGCPHWHMLLFVEPVFAKQAEQIMRQYMHLSGKGDIRKIVKGCQVTKHDRLELNTEKAKRARFDCKRIDNSVGSAAAYIAKYIAKNIDANGLEDAYDYETGKQGMERNALRVRAWASVHNIRQFQQIGGAPVGVWRELRRLKKEAPSEPMEAMRIAAGLKDGEEFASYGEYARLYAKHPIKFLKRDKENGYGETSTENFGLTGAGAVVITRDESWVLGFSSGGETDTTWINENNCRTPEFESGKPLSAANKLLLLDMEIERPSLSNFDTWEII